MQARDIMTSNAATVAPETEIREITALLLRLRTGAALVVDSVDRVMGIVSEGDLIRRTGDSSVAWPQSWGLSVFASPQRRVEAFVETHGLCAKDIMTREVICVPDDASLHYIAALLERNRINRVPVTRGGRLVGIVSRTNLLQGFVARQAALRSVSSTDNYAIREKLIDLLKEADLFSLGFVDIVVCGGIVHLWGAVRSHGEANAMRNAAENLPSVQQVRSHLRVMPTILKTGVCAE